MIILSEVVLLEYDSLLIKNHAQPPKIQKDNNASSNGRV